MHSRLYLLACLALGAGCGSKSIGDNHYKSIQTQCGIPPDSDFLEHNRTEAELKKALGGYESLCLAEVPHALSCNGLGLMYEWGWAVPRNHVKAREYYRKSCDLAEPDDAIGCDNLGLLLVRGQGGPTDIKAAKKLFEKACSELVPQACCHLRSLP